MSKCPSCGGDVTTTQSKCYYCGKDLSFEQTYEQSSVKPQPRETVSTVDTGGFWWGLLGFCLPLVGLILFLVWNQERPNTAKAAGIGALLSVVLPILFYVFFMLLFVIFAGCSGPHG